MVIHKYHELETDTFNQRPFFRLILNIIYDISRKNYKFDENIILTVYTAFSTLLHRLEPNNYPGFSFAWLELISSKYFMPAIL
jgi:CCR4-NOT transcription complex subunit 1